MKAVHCIKNYFGTAERPVTMTELKELRGFGLPPDERARAQADYLELAAGAAVELDVELES